ncbi:unnamed protein product [Psylliodes chrysocephalus]|uniref:Uncharacterized protein n=1 Tax=Psylliodes chrysocephalus TaxID=3402493 RepID=A0A9P0CS22_9CUCU|nr:unnamed protein product [Psylliodes chrysocephala]
MFYRKLENGEILRRDWAIYSESTATRELAFRGSNEKIGEDHKGNYLGAIEILSEYDPFLKDHIRRLANRGKGTVSYLSKDIGDEFVGIISNEVLKKIVKQIKVNKYYSMVQEIYTFFTASSYKWNLLSQFIEVSENEKLLTKRVNTTRWLSRFDAIKALGHSYASIKIEQISQNREEKGVERVEAASFAETLDLLENGILLTFWLDILHRTNDVNKALFITREYGYKYHI